MDARPHSWTDEPKHVLYGRMVTRHRDHIRPQTITIIKTPGGADTSQVHTRFRGSPECGL